MKEVTNQKIEEEDAKLALNVQSEEAYKVILQWKREENDSKLAAQLEEALIEEKKLQESLALAKDKEEALKVAMDERRRVQQERKEREELERMDFEFAQRFFVEEGNRILAMKKLCEDDEKFVQKLYSQYNANNSQAKEDDIDSFEELKLDDVKHCDDEKDCRTKDDFETAMKLQRELDIENSLAKTKQEISDFRLSRRLLIKTSREQHQRSQRTKALAKLPCSTSGLSSAAAGRLWEQAEAAVEDVCGGICITLLLPHIVRLRVSRCKARMVRIEASRLVEKGDKFADGYNSQFVADFNIQGKGVQLADSDLSYDYYSDIGLLHVYIENVSLDGFMVWNRFQKSWILFHNSYFTNIGKG